MFFYFLNFPFFKSFNYFRLAQHCFSTFFIICFLKIFFDLFTFFNFLNFFSSFRPYNILNFFFYFSTIPAFFVFLNPSNNSNFLNNSIRVEFFAGSNSLHTPRFEIELLNANLYQCRPKVACFYPRNA